MYTDDFCLGLTLLFFVSLFSQISAVRLPREPSNPDRLKGFGYAEFEDLDSLLSALSLNEEVEKLRVGVRRAGERAQLLERCCFQRTWV